MMAFEEWEPVYERILAAFGYDREGDERARDVVVALLEDKETLTVDDLDWTGKRVAIAGAGPSLTEPAELELARGADIVVGASVAADRLLSRGIEVDCFVTDLDKNPETVERLSTAGIPVAVHAHGDNIPAVREYVPAANSAMVLPTTQAAPRNPVVNPGGFTDGDRAAFLADAAGGETLVFPGWDFDDPSLDEEKLRKLVWAERLLCWLEQRRGERFAVLDGRRGDVDTEPLPVD